MAEYSKTAAASALARRFLAQREAKVEVEPGVRLTVRMPEPLYMAERRWSSNSQMAMDSVTGWDGMTEAVLLGASQGSDAAVEFSPELWQQVAPYRIDWLAKAAERVGELIRASAAEQEARAGN